MKHTKLFSVESWVSQFFGNSEFAAKRYKSGYHEGLDLVPIDRKSWDLFSPTHGVVMWAGWGDTYGHNVIIYDTISGISYRYCHLESYSVSRGSVIRPGDKFAVAGNSGKSLGRHLHLNAVLMTKYGIKDFNNNGFKGRFDPLPALRALRVHI